MTEKTNPSTPSARPDNIERHRYDVIVIGAGGAGLRAAIEARLAGKRTAIISKSLFGKAHTVMAEGGAAAAMGNVDDRDDWRVFRADRVRPRAAGGRRFTPRRLPGGGVTAFIAERFTGSPDPAHPPCEVGSGGLKANQGSQFCSGGLNQR